MIPYMVGKLAPKSSHLTRGLVKYVSGRSYFRTVPSQNGDKMITSPPPPVAERVFRPPNTVQEGPGDITKYSDSTHEGNLGKVPRHCSTLS